MSLIGADTENDAATAGKLKNAELAQPEDTTNADFTNERRFIKILLTAM
jgi:hypothetical protein